MTEQDWLKRQRAIRDLVVEDNGKFVTDIGKAVSARLGTHTHVMISIIPIDKDNKSEMICFADTMRGNEGAYLEIMHAITAKLLGWGVAEEDAASEVPSGPLQ